MARRAVEQELSRERILFAARELFVEHGYRAVSMRKIANELGYSHGSLYYYFQDKADLFYALVVEDFNFLLSKQKELLYRIERHDLTALRELMLEFIKFGLEHPHHYEIMFMMRDSELHRYPRSEQAECLNMFASIIREALGKHPERDSLHFTLPWNLFMALHGFVSWCIHYGQSYQEVENLAKQHVALMVMALEAGGTESVEARPRDIAKSGVGVRIVG